MSDWNAQAGAMVLRASIADVLSSHTQLSEPIRDKQLQELLGGGVPLITIKRNRAWVRKAFKLGKIPALYEFVAKGRRGERPKWKW